MRGSNDLHWAITRSENNMRRFMILMGNVVDQFCVMIMFLLSLYFKVGKILMNHHSYKIP